MLRKEHLRAGETPLYEMGHIVHLMRFLSNVLQGKVKEREKAPILLSVHQPIETHCITTNHSTVFQLKERKTPKIGQEGPLATLGRRPALPMAHWLGAQRGPAQEVVAA